jgi:hypothetical protein
VVEARSISTGEECPGSPCHAAGHVRSSMRLPVSRGCWLALPRGGGRRKGTDHRSPEIEGTPLSEVELAAVAKALARFQAAIRGAVLGSALFQACICSAGVMAILPGSLLPPPLDHFKGPW